MIGAGTMVLKMTSYIHFQPVFIGSSQINQGGASLTQNVSNDRPLCTPLAKHQPGTKQSGWNSSSPGMPALKCTVHSLHQVSRSDSTQLSFVQHLGCRAVLFMGQSLCVAIVGHLLSVCCIIARPARTHSANCPSEAAKNIHMVLGRKDRQTNELRRKRKTHISKLFYISRCHNTPQLLQAYQVFYNHCPKKMLHRY